MSLIIAAHNETGIVIGTESLSTITRSDGSRTQDKSVQKVTPINPRLALMITGRYMSDKLSFLGDYVSSTVKTFELDQAFEKLIQQAKRQMVVHSNEGFRIGLASYNTGRATFKCMTVVYSRNNILEGATANYYLSGDKEPVEFAELLINSGSILGRSKTLELETAVREILDSCIQKYPQTLGSPVTTLILSS